MASVFRPSFIRSIAVASALLLGACATTQQKPTQDKPIVMPAPVMEVRPAPQAAEASTNPVRESLRSQLVLQDRLYRLSAPLLVNNAALCKSQARKLLGFSAKNKFSFSADLADTAHSEFGFDEHLQVTNVLPGSGADNAGVRRGDILIAVDGAALPQGEDAERHAAALLAPLVQARSSLPITLMRDKTQLTLDIPLTLACAFSIELGNAELVNAFDDGRRIAINRGMIGFTQSDEELAYVIAREMAHNILGHAPRLRMNATIAGIIDNLIRVNPDLSTMTGMAGIKPYPATLDAAADRLALFLAARAGYSIDNAARFWQRLADAYPASVLNAYTAIHPATAQRMAMLNKTTGEIRVKQASNRPLLP